MFEVYTRDSYERFVAIFSYYLTDPKAAHLLKICLASTGRAYAI